MRPESNVAVDTIAFAYHLLIICLSFALHLLSRVILGAG
jgi:hypothetical protein